MLKKTGEVIFLIIVIALVFRVIGIQHSFPFIFHPDEPTVVRSALGIRFDPNPKHFDWPHLYIYFNFFIYMVFAKLRDLVVELNFKDQIANFLPILWNDDLIFYLITRLFTAVLGALTVLPIYLAGRRLFNEKVGMLGALLFALIPFHVTQSHYSLPDVPMLFFFSWSLYFAAGILDSRDTSNYSEAGFFTGLAASSKYNGGLGAINVPIAHLLRILSGSVTTSSGKRESIFDFKSLFDLIISGVLAAIGFFLGTPFAILDSKTFLRTDGPQGAMWQFTNVGSVNFAEHFPKMLDNLVNKLAGDMGYTILLGFFVMLIISIVRLIQKKRTLEDLGLWFLYIPGLILFYYVSGFSKTRSQYFMIVYPYFTLVCAYFIYFVFSHINRLGKWFQILSFAFLGVMLFLPFYFSAMRSVSFFNNDTRDYAYTWLSSKVAPGDTIVYDDSKLQDIVDALKVQKQKGFTNLGGAGQGYVLVLPQDTDSVRKFQILARQALFKNFTEVYKVDDTNKLGPSITIYKFDSIK